MGMLTNFVQGMLAKQLGEAGPTVFPQWYQPGGAIYEAQHAQDLARQQTAAQIAQQQDQYTHQQDIARTLPGAQAFAQMNPNLGAGGSYVLQQMAQNDPAQARAMMGAYSTGVGAQPMRNQQIAASQQAMTQSAQKQPLELAELRARTRLQDLQYNWTQAKLNNFHGMEPEQYIKGIEGLSNLNEGQGAVERLYNVAKDGIGTSDIIANGKARGQVAADAAQVLYAIKQELAGTLGEAGGASRYSPEEMKHLEAVLGNPSQLKDLITQRDSYTLGVLGDIRQRLARKRGLLNNLFGNPQLSMPKTYYGDVNPAGLQPVAPPPQGQSPLGYALGGLPGTLGAIGSAASAGGGILSGLPGGR